MATGIQRVRGALGMGLTWAFAWSAAGALPRWLFGFNPDAPFPLIFGVLGFMAGILFFGILSLVEGRRSFEQMSLPRFAVWGGVGGLLLSAIFTRMASLGASDVMLITPVFAAACAICASGSLALARRASVKELPDNRWATAEAELASQKKRQLR